MRDPYSPFEALVAPARPTAALIRLVLGMIMVTVLFFSLIFATTALLSVIVPSPSASGLGPDLENGTSPLGVLLNLFVFIYIILAVMMTARAVHARDLISLVGDWRYARLQFGRALLYLIGLNLVLSFILPTPPEMTPVPNLSMSTWLSFLPVALLALLIQTGAEEIAFRGYIQSQLAARFSDPKIWIILPSLGFGLLHWDSSLDETTAWMIVTWATLFGLAAADITARCGTIGPAIALHFVNNFFAILLAAPRGSFDGLALYVYPFDLQDADLLLHWAPVNVLMLFVSWLTVRLALRV